MLIAVLALSAAAVLHGLLRPPRPGHARARVVFDFAALALFCAHALSWLTLGAGGATALPPELSWSELLARSVPAFVLGPLAFRSLRSQGPGWLRAGLAAGLVSCVLGFGAYRWTCVAAAWRLIGGFSGVFMAALLPWLLALLVALAVLSLAHEDWRPSAPRLLLALLLPFTGGADWALHRLRRDWDYGPRALAEAASVRAARGAVSFSVLWLKTVGDASAAPETRSLEAQGLEVSGETLDRLKLYLLGRGLRTLFKEQAVRALREGWRLWWDADRALEADMLAAPGLVPPDYRGALTLLRTGPITAERYGRLEQLARLARDRKEGFEDVTQAQYIFEGFSAAYARFGDEEQARAWLLRIDNLWPIYEKKIEASPLETFRTGRIAGTLLQDGAPARGLLVGLFMVPVSSGAARADAVLSSSDFPDENGGFEFKALGKGRYFVGIMGPAAALGRAEPSPGVVTLDEDHSDIVLPPVRVLPRGARPEGP